ncbi:hypothetical protein STA3757_07330 [Stanieria sp. NIES-3757]|nr:hypothetical protein STA3757_07330 [Stanieria sp. NIES-3757]
MNWKRSSVQKAVRPRGGFLRKGTRTKTKQDLAVACRSSFQNESDRQKYKLAKILIEFLVS